jgi:hypothetical protein
MPWIRFFIHEPALSTSLNEALSAIGGWWLEKDEFDFLQEVHANGNHSTIAKNRSFFIVRSIFTQLSSELKFCQSLPID